MNKTELFNYYSSKITELSVKLTRAYDTQLRAEFGDLEIKVETYDQYRDTYLELTDYMDEILDSKLSNKDKTKLYRMFLNVNRKIVSIDIVSFPDNLNRFSNVRDVKKDAHTVPAGKEDEFLSNIKSSDEKNKNVEVADDNDFVPHHFRNTHI